MKRRIAGLALSTALFVCAALLASAGLRTTASADDKPAMASIVIDNFSFAPRELTVAKGTIVTWVNHDDVPHTVVSKDQKFRSKALDTDDRFSFAFTDAGVYVYFCSVHPIMIGKVIVK